MNEQALHWLERVLLWAGRCGGWSVRLCRASTGTRYFKFRHPVRGKLAVRLGDHRGRWGSQHSVLLGHVVTLADVIQKLNRSRLSGGQP